MRILFFIAIIALALPMAYARVSALDLLERRVQAESAPAETILAETKSTVSAEALTETMSHAEAQAAIEARLEAMAEHHAMISMKRAAAQQAREELEQRAKHQLAALVELEAADDSVKVPHPAKSGELAVKVPKGVQHSVVRSIAEQVSKASLEKQSSLNEQVNDLKKNIEKLKAEHEKARKNHRVNNQVLEDGWPAKPNAQTQREQNKFVDAIMSQYVKPEFTIVERSLRDAAKTRDIAEKVHADYHNWQEDVKEMRLLPPKGELI